MNKTVLDQMWDQFRQKYGVYLRLLETIPADRYFTCPIPGMRTPAELIVHLSGTVVRDIAEGVARGEITADEAGEATTAAELGVAFHVLGDEFMHHRGQLYAYARACGMEPPFMWGYADNAPEFQPRAEAATAGA